MVGVAVGDGEDDAGVAVVGDGVGAFDDAGDGAVAADGSAHDAIAVALGRIEDLFGDGGRVVDERVGFAAAVAAFEVVELLDVVVGPAEVTQRVGDLKMAGELIGRVVVAELAEGEAAVAGGHDGVVGGAVGFDPAGVGGRAAVGEGVGDGGGVGGVGVVDAAGGGAVELGVGRLVLVLVGVSTADDARLLMAGASWQKGRERSARGHSAGGSPAASGGGRNPGELAGGDSGVARRRRGVWAAGGRLAVDRPARRRWG